MRLIFMGTPEFAVPALQALIDSGHTVVAVYTQPPRPAGRGQKEQPGPVHLLANTHHIPVFTPATLKTPEVQQAFADLQADAAIVAAYGLILPQPILSACRYGCINIHPSLLPRWRGAAPIQRAIMAGDTETGICIMQMDKGLDTGDILLMECVAIPEQCTAGQLHDQLASGGAKLLLKTLAGLEKGVIHPQKQAGEGVTYAEKISKEEGLIDWNQPAQMIQCLIRGLTPWPGAYFIYQGEKIKILEAHKGEETSATPGTIVTTGKTIGIACADGLLIPTLAQRAGRGVIPMEALLRGFPMEAGYRL